MLNEFLFSFFLKNAGFSYSKMDEYNTESNLPQNRALCPEGLRPLEERVCLK